METCFASEMLISMYKNKIHPLFFAVGTWNAFAQLSLMGNKFLSNAYNEISTCHSKLSRVKHASSRATVKCKDRKIRCTSSNLFIFMYNPLTDPTARHFYVKQM